MAESEAEAWGLVAVLRQRRQEQLRRMGRAGWVHTSQGGSLGLALHQDTLLGPSSVSLL